MYVCIYIYIYRERERYLRRIMTGSVSRYTITAIDTHAVAGYTTVDMTCVIYDLYRYTRSIPPISWSHLDCSIPTVIIQSGRTEQAEMQALAIVMASVQARVVHVCVCVCVY